MWGSTGSQASCEKGSKKLCHQTSILLPVMFYSMGLLVGRQGKKIGKEASS